MKTKTPSRIPLTDIPVSNGETRKPTSEDISKELLERRARVERASQEIQGILQRERCQIRVASLVLRPDGGINPVIQIDVEN